jgi:hypothetical protein
MPSQNEVRNEIIQIYFDCICGSICSITALIGIFIFVLPSVISGDMTYNLVWLFIYILICNRRRNFHPLQSKELFTRCTSKKEIESSYDKLILNLFSLIDFF